MYKVVGGLDLKNYHLYSWNKKNTNIPLENFAAISSPDVHKMAVGRAINKIRTTGQVGAKLATFALRSKNLEIVCWPGVPGEFLCHEELAECTTPTIMWDPYKCFEYYGRSYKKAYSPSGELEETDWVYKPALMPSWMVLGHEIGHYWHYVNTVWFVQFLRSDDIAGIERENLKDHEEPMLKAAGLPIRHQYQEFKGGSQDPLKGKKHLIEGGFPHPSNDYCETIPGGLGNGLAELKRKMCDAAKKEEERRAKDSKVDKSQMVKSACPVCKETFVSERALNFHRKFENCN
jgi:hypothetical protein